MERFPVYRRCFFHSNPKFIHYRNGSWNGKPLYPSSVKTWWSRFTKRHKLKYIRFHDLRHTSATLLINKGVHAKIISERLGHANILTTMNIYGHALRSADQEAAKHFESLFDSQPKSKKA
ncbi:site-specific integrase [Brevibacillus sp. CF112]|uniref:site-specific integrase n=1 Tax=Brevibacillus TaxID=55080 RepID=UPI001ED8FBF6|nr:site-specific integrase [Brevibacillus sp. CF112]